MRLIDADATIPMIKYATTDNEIGVFPIKIGFNEIVKVLNAQPTVEAIPMWFIKGCQDDHLIFITELLNAWEKRKEE